MLAVLYEYAITPFTSDSAEYRSPGYRQSDPTAPGWWPDVV
jgi:hypothetical protein